MGLRSEVNVEDALGLAECKLTCPFFATFWPHPTGGFLADPMPVVDIDPDHIEFANKDVSLAVPDHEWIESNIVEQVEWLKKKKPPSLPQETSENAVKISFNFTASSQQPQIRKDTDESYGIRTQYDQVWGPPYTNQQTDVTH